MKFASLLIISFLFFQFTSLAQEGWVQQTSNTDFNLRSVYFVNEINGWAVGGDWDSKDGVLLSTTNSGISWNKEIIDSVRLQDIQFINEETAFIIGGKFIPFSSSFVFKTSNSGQNWDTIHITEAGPMPNEVFFTSKDTGWMARSWYFPGNSSWYCLLKTTDGGQSWFELNSPPEPFIPINSICFIGNNGWLTTAHTLSFGGGGKIYKTTDGGNNWQFQFEMTQGSGGRPGRISLSIFFLDTYLGWAVGGGGWRDTLTLESGMYRIIFNTTDGGTNWDIQLCDSIQGNNHLDYYALLDVQFIDNNIGWAVGESGNILRTTDGGLNWHKQESWTTETLVSVFFIDENIGWVVGANGTILHTTNGGVSSVEEEPAGIPTDFSLKQNFPNPFNPSTNIRYSIPHRSQVIIRVYDMLGNEIKTLVNEEKFVGTYVVNWNEANLPSGVYFYQLRAVDPSTRSGQVFIQTKKMILLK